jgi:hypothetical protein
MITSTFKKILTKKIPIQTAFKLTSRHFANKNPAPFDVDSIPEVEDSANPSTQPVYTHQTNYNFEEHPEYAETVERAKLRREEIDALREKASVPRRERYVYDRPLYDLDLTNYSAWREISDSVLTKEYPHDLNRQLGEVEISPKDFLHVFGESLENSRNDTYSTKEWDFTDSNLDKFLVYDYKATTDYWGENMSDEFYAVNCD